MDMNKQLIPIEFNSDKQIYINSIIGCFESKGYKCKKSMAKKILKRFKQFPEDGDTLWLNLKFLFAPILKDCPKDVVEKELLNLVDNWKLSQDSITQSLVDQQMTIATDGLEEHPEWFEYPCLCNLCRSYA